jgi:hypothetical protein
VLTAICNQAIFDGSGAGRVPKESLEGDACASLI